MELFIARCALNRGMASNKMTSLGLICCTSSFHRRDHIFRSLNVSLARTIWLAVLQQAPLTCCAPQNDERWVEWLKRSRLLNTFTLIIELSPYSQFTPEWDHAAADNQMPRASRRVLFSPKQSSGSVLLSPTQTGKKNSSPYTFPFDSRAIQASRLGSSRETKRQ